MPTGSPRPSVRAGVCSLRSRPPQPPLPCCWPPAPPPPNKSPLPPEAVADAVVSTTCTMTMLTAVQGLRTCRSWITYSPKDFGSVSEAQLTADLTLLFSQGSRAPAPPNRSSGLSPPDDTDRRLTAERGAVGDPVAHRRVYPHRLNRPGVTAQRRPTTTSATPSGSLRRTRV